jgi:hypothetical protein
MRGEEPMHLIVGPLPVHLSNLLYNLEIAYMAAGLDQAQGVKARAAELLGMNRTTLVERLKRLKALQARQGGMVDAMREHLKGLNGERLPKRKDSAKVPFRG